MLKVLKLNLEKAINVNNTKIAEYIDDITKNPLCVVDIQENMYTSTLILNNSKQLFEKLNDGFYNANRPYDVIKGLIENSVMSITELDRSSDRSSDIVKYNGTRKMLIYRLIILADNFEFEPTDKFLGDMVFNLLFN